MYQTKRGSILVSEGSAPAISQDPSPRSWFAIISQMVTPSSTVWGLSFQALISPFFSFNTKSGGDLQCLLTLYYLSVTSFLNSKLWQKTKNAKMRTKGYLANAFHSKGVNHHHVHLAPTPRQTESGESLWWKKGKVSGVLWLGLVGMRNLGGRLVRSRVSWDWFGEHIWFGTYSPKLGEWWIVDKENRETSVHWSSLGRAGLTSTEVKGQSSFVIHTRPLFICIPSCSPQMPVQIIPLSPFCLNV